MSEEQQVEQSADLIAFRLNNIESQLAEMQQLIKTNIIQDKDINNLQDRMTLAENDIVYLKSQVNVLRQEPIKKSAKRWEYVIDYIFKALVAIGVTAMLIKMGLSK